VNETLLPAAMVALGGERVTEPGGGAVVSGGVSGGANPELAPAAATADGTAAGGGRGGYFVWLNSMKTRGPRGVSSAYCFSSSVRGVAMPSQLLSEAGRPFTKMRLPP